jgi:regulator of sigma E protease
VVLFTGLFLAVGHTVRTPVIGNVVPGSPAQAAGIRAGDLVTRLDGQAVDDFEQLPQIISMSAGKPLAVELMRAGRPLQLTVTPRLTQTRDALGDAERRMTVGIVSDPRAPLVTTHYNLFQAAGAACSRTGEIVVLSLKGIGQLITGQASMEQLRGPVGIAQITRKVALFGILPFISLIAVLSVSIGLINLFPIPLLDGGHLLYYACEAVLGRPLDERAQDVGFRLGLVMVLGLMLLATWNDLARLNLF